MTSRIGVGRPRHLAASEPGTLRIERIVFGAVRTLCRRYGIREGDVIRCRSSTASHVRVETRAGRTVVLARDWAKFVQVRPATGRGRRIRAAGGGRASIAG